MELVEITAHYLEMLVPSQRMVPAPSDGLRVIHIPKPTVPYYQALYDAVGKDYHWLRCTKLSDKQLAAILHDPHDELHVLQVEGTPAGFAELDRSQPEVELVLFGLTSEFIGQGLGKWFLRWTIEKVWSYQPKCLWLHTCTLDHPAALPMYRKAGFVQFRQKTRRKEI